MVRVTISGAVNSEKHTHMLIPYANYSVGIEGGVFRNDHGTFLG